MTAPPVTIGMDDTLRTVRRIFQERKFHHLIVMDEGQVVGVLSDRDLLKRLSPFVGVQLSERQQDVDTLRTKAHQMMTRQLVAVEPDVPLGHAARLMIRRNVSCLPVIDASGSLVGILTLRDLARWLVKQHIVSNT